MIARNSTKDHERSQEEISEKCKSIWKATEGGHGMLKFQRAIVFHAEIGEITEAGLQCLDAIYDIFVRKTRRQFYEKD